jgi:hypothetical protein
MNASRKQLVDNLLTSCRQLESPDAGVEDAKAVGQWCSIMVGNMPVPWGPHTTEDAAVLGLLLATRLVSDLMLLCRRGLLVDGWASSTYRDALAAWHVARVEVERLRSVSASTTTA